MTSPTCPGVPLGQFAVDAVVGSNWLIGGAADGPNEGNVACGSHVKWINLARRFNLLLPSIVGSAFAPDSPLSVSSCLVGAISLH